MYKQVFFDVDGTIIDSTEAIFEAFKTAYRELNLEYPGNQRIQDEFGKGLRPILHILDVPENLHEEFVNIFTKSELESDNFRVYPGMEKVLDFIKSKDLPVICVTSKRSATAKHVFETLELDDKIDLVISADDVERTKPDPEPLLMAKKQMNIDDTDQILYVGDTLFDIQAAKSADMTPVGVIWGTHNQKLKNMYPDELLVETPEELLTLLQQKLVK